MEKLITKQKLIKKLKYEIKNDSKRKMKNK